MFGWGDICGPEKAWKTARVENCRSGREKEAFFRLGGYMRARKGGVPVK